MKLLKPTILETATTATKMQATPKIRGLLFWIALLLNCVAYPKTASYLILQFRKRLLTPKASVQVF